jgi:hypothetical protein
MRSEGISVPDPIGIHPTPEEIGVFHTTTKQNALLIRATKIPEHVFNGGHIEFSGELNIFVEF